MRPSRQWAHLALVVVLLLGIAVFAQAIAERHSVRFDLTPGRELSLSESTRRVLELLPEPIHVTAYYGRESFQEMAERMRLFEGAAPNFRARLVQLDRHPGLARRDGVDRHGKALLRYGDRKLVVEATSESALAGALLRLLRGRPTRILFLQGHGERDVADVTAPAGYGELFQALGQESHDLGRLPVLRGGVPEGTDLVVIAGPKHDLLEEEAEALGRWVEAGGHLLALLDPVPLPNLERLVRRFGIDASLDVVRDSTNRILGSDPFTVAVPTFGAHAIAGSQTTPALFAVARSVDAAPRAGAEVIARTYREAWAMRDLERAGDPEVAPREGEDRPGPIPVMAAASASVGGDRETRVVVAGDSDFATNALLGLLGNRDLVLNAIAWAVSAEAVVARRPESRVEALRPLSPLVLSGSQGRRLFLLTVVLQPLLVVALGSAVALRRRWYG